MKVRDLFNVKYGVNLELITLEMLPLNDKSGVNFVARTSENNGVVARVRKIEGLEPQPAGVLSCAGGGSVLSAFVQTEPFYSGRDLYTLTPKKKMTLAEKLYYCMCIKANAYRYSYGRQANKTLKDIELPGSIPDWVNNVPITSYATINADSALRLRNIVKWGEFALGELFTISGTKTTKTEDLSEYGRGEYPYVTTQATRNGVAGFFDFYTEKGNVLTIDSAVLGYCSYQARHFSASDHVEKLTPKFMLNKHIALFLTTVINREQYKYSYGRKFSQKKIRASTIKLPVTMEGVPDWSYMEQYIKSLPYGDRI